MNVRREDLSTPRTRGRRVAVVLLAGVTGAAAVVALATWATGGIRFTPFGLRVSSSNVWRPLLLASVGLLALLPLVRDRETFASRLRQAAVPVALTALAAFIGWHAAPYAAAADMYGYVSQAMDWRAGSLVHTSWVRDTGGFPIASAVPLGYVLDSGPPPAAVALYPPGTSLHMAFAGLAGSWAMYAVSPLAAIALVLGTDVLGRRWFTADVARIGAVLTAFSPVLLAQAIVPMSDTLAAAYWTWSLACAASRRWQLQAVAGALAGVAIAVRPNLAPLLAVVLACAAWSAGWRGAVAAAAGCTPFVGALALHNARLYGAPLATGYGGSGELFSLAHVAVNVRNYASWLIATMSPLPIVGAALYAGRAARRRPAHLPLLAFVAINVGLYLAYLPWPDWTFARFLLPSVPLLCLMSAATAVRLARGRSWLLAVLFLVTLGWQLQFAQASTLRYTRAAMSRFAELPFAMARAGLLDRPIVTRLHSGSLRLYGGARTFRWDHMSPEELRNGLMQAEAAGQQPLFVDDSDDREPFEARFGPLRCWADESPPLVQLERHATVTVLRARVRC